MNKILIIMSLLVLNVQAYEIKTKDYTLRANVGKQILEENKVVLSGDVRITYDQSTVLRAEKVTYNTKNKDMSLEGVHLKMKDFYEIRAKKVTSNLDELNKTFIFTNATIFVSEKENVFLNAETIKWYPQMDKIEIIKFKKK